MQTTTFGWTYRARKVALGLAAFAVTALALTGLAAMPQVGVVMSGH